MRKGIGVSPGVVVGVAHRVESVLGSIEQQALDHPDQVPAEIERFDRAVMDAAADLEALIQKVAQELGDSAADIFKGHLQIVNDPAQQPVFVHCVGGKHRTGVMTAAYCFRITVEERMMLTTFGVEYEEYQRKTWRLVPLLF